MEKFKDTFFSFYFVEEAVGASNKSKGFLQREALPCLEQLTFFLIQTFLVIFLLYIIEANTIFARIISKSFRYKIKDPNNPRDLIEKHTDPNISFES